MTPGIEYGVLTIIGRKGAGKTATAKWLINRWHNDGWPIVSNITIKDFKATKMELDELPAAYPDIYDSIIVMDECHIQNGKFRFFEEAVRKVDDFASQIRKRHCIFVMITQRMDKLSRNLRLETDYVLQVESPDFSTFTPQDYEQYRIPPADRGKSVPGIVLLTVIDNVALGDDDAIVNQFYVDVRPIFGTYDTDEIITASGTYSRTADPKTPAKKKSTPKK